MGLMLEIIFLVSCNRCVASTHNQSINCDPIEVSDVPQARDECYSRLPGIFSRLIRNSKDHEIATERSIGSDSIDLDELLKFGIREQLILILAVIAP